MIKTQKKEGTIIRHRKWYVRAECTNTTTTLSVFSDDIEQEKLCHTNDCVGDVSFPHFIQIIFCPSVIQEKNSSNIDVKKTTWDADKYMSIVNGIP